MKEDDDDIVKIEVIRFFDLLEKGGIKDKRWMNGLHILG